MQVTANYNFVPVANTIVRPAWGPQVTHDKPLPGGLCAWFDLTLVNHTPLMVGGVREGDGPATANFYRHPDGVAAIPGSSVQGMARALIEILSFSRMQFFDDRQLAIRDLSPRSEYLRKMVQTTGNKVQARAQAGWLRFDASGQWQMVPCDYALVSHEALKAHLDVDIQGKYSSRDDAHRLVNWKYSLFEKKLGGDKKHVVWTDRPHALPKALNGGLTLHRRVADQIKLKSDPTCPCTGHLVLTGQPSPRNPETRKGKHFEFVFYEPAAGTASMPVPPEVFSNFLATHDLGDPDSAYAFLTGQKSPFDRAQGIPVFYFPTPGQAIGAIGLSQLARWPYPKRLGGYLPACHQPGPSHRAAPLDFTEALFGKIDIADARSADLPPTALKRRIFFGDLRLTVDEKRAGPGFEIPVVLAAPQQTYYPTYVKQTSTTGLITLLDEHAELSGWKRYPVWNPDRVTGFNNIPGLEDLPNSVKTKMLPLCNGMSFTGRVYMHNVMPEELGAMIWALTWGGDDSMRHALGMGKGLGLGQVRASINNLTIRPNQPGSEMGGADCTEAFERWMSDQLKATWRDTVQVKTLQAMADPKNGTKDRLMAMTFSMDRDANQFQQRKNRYVEPGAYGLPNYRSS